MDRDVGGFAVVCAILHTPLVHLPRVSESRAYEDEILLQIKGRHVDPRYYTVVDESSEASVQDAGKPLFASVEREVSDGSAKRRGNQQRIPGG